MVLSLLIHWLLVLPLFGGYCDWCLFCYALLSGFHFCNHLAEEEMAGYFTLIVFLLALLIVFCALCLFLTVSWIGLHFVIVAFPGHAYLFFEVHLVRELAILLIKWLRPKGFKVCSYVEKYAELKNQTVKKIGWYTKVLWAMEYPGGRQFLKLALKWGTLYTESNLTYLAPP